MANPVGWFEIYVDDMARAKAFYQQVLATELTALEFPGMEMHTFPMDMLTYGASGALVKMPGIAAGGNSVLVYFSCDDCQVEQERVTAAGGSIVKPKFSIGEHGFIALGYDTEGNMFGMHSNR
ncbi:MAG: VOC family protein [Shewanella sp.]|uniref:VOC family protein n=1 Tax=Shewanella sp. SNU WT4 TaxID=2590015 RepID=UPI001129E540|nr:VOC family protein [Shewanella sp. SNU WT4]QDF65606.1 VOC family protein [Shewanella sp. SNU WT4]